MSIYVGNLSYEVTQEDLTAAFAEYGSVNRGAATHDRETGVYAVYRGNGLNAEKTAAQ